MSGRIISFKPNPHLRPTADKTRKAIFDMLQGQIHGKRVLDLFCGTGALGLEALSSGADLVVFVETDKAQSLALKNNLEKMNLSQKSQVLTADALKMIEKLSRDGRLFDFIFLDPPYEKGLGQKTMAVLARSAIVSKGTIIVLECRDLETLPETGDSFECLRNKVYGSTRILVYRRL